MSYYHVRLVRRSDLPFQINLTPDNYETIFDLGEDELESRILSPYRCGNPITIRGTSITASELGRILISRSDEESKILRAAVVERTGERHMHNDWLTAARGDDVTDEYIVGPPGSDSPSQVSESDRDSPLTDTRNVFVVHGRDLVARDALFDFLRAIDLRPLEWSEAVQATGRSAPYIGDVLDAAFSRAHAVIVLFTPDDNACLRDEFRSSSDPPHETEPTGQARPNVLFEAGMAMGRNQDRTILVELGTLRPFSDVAGRHTIRLDNSSQRRQELAQRLEAAGCLVNLNGTDWHLAGDFSSSAE